MNRDNKVSRTNTFPLHTAFADLQNKAASHCIEAYKSQGLHKPHSTASVHSLAPSPAKPCQAHLIPQKQAPYRRHRRTPSILSTPQHRA